LEFVCLIKLLRNRNCEHTPHSVFTLNLNVTAHSNGESAGYCKPQTRTLNSFITDSFPYLNKIAEQFFYVFGLDSDTAVFNHYVKHNGFIVNDLVSNL
jgi:hypothetical protein